MNVERQLENEGRSCFAGRGRVQLLGRLQQARDAAVRLEPSSMTKLLSALLTTYATRRRRRCCNAFSTLNSRPGRIGQTVRLLDSPALAA